MNFIMSFFILVDAPHVQIPFAHIFATSICYSTSLLICIRISLVQRKWQSKCYTRKLHQDSTLHGPPTTYHTQNILSPYYITKTLKNRILL